MEFNNLKEALELVSKEYKTPGSDCIVYKNHEEIFRYHTGYSDLKNKKKIDGSELYFIFSMTKMLTCTCALQLFEQGKYKMSDYLYQYMSEFENMRITKDDLNTENAAKITSGSSMGEHIDNSDDGYAKKHIKIVDLFTMSSGLDYDLNPEGVIEAKKQGKSSTRDLVGALSKTVLGFEPGERYRYSLSHDVLGALIEIWSGMSLGEYMKKNLFEPIGMKNTFFGVPKDKKLLSRMAKRYTVDENGGICELPVECIYNLSDEYESGGAGLVSTTEDYALFLDAMADNGLAKSGNRILMPSTVELMHTNRLNGKRYEDFQNLRKGYGYGMGVRVHLYPEVSGSISPVGEFGWDGAAGSFAMADTINNISLTYFQHCHSWDDKLQGKLRNALYKDLGDSVRQTEE